MQLTALLKIILRLVPLSVLALTARPLTFNPAEGSSLKKLMSSEWNVQVDELLIAIDGSTWWAGSTMDAEIKQHIAITDTYLIVEDGRPTALDRKFDKISQSLGSSRNDAAGKQMFEDMSGTSELEGAVVQFRRGEDGYDIRFAPQHRDLDYALLDGLTEDMDLRTLLPHGPARVGEEWELELTALPDLLSPGGYFAWTIESGGATRLLSDSLDAALMGELRQVLGATLEGRATIEYLSDQNNHSELGIKINVQGKEDLDDLSDLAKEIVDEFAEVGTIEVVRLDLVFTLEAAGTGKWDTVQRHIAELVLKGEMEVSMNLEVLLPVSVEHLISVKAATSAEFIQTLSTQR